MIIAAKIAKDLKCDNFGMCVCLTVCVYTDILPMCMCEQILRVCVRACQEPSLNIASMH